MSKVTTIELHSFAVQIWQLFQLIKVRASINDFGEGKNDRKSIGQDKSQSLELSIPKCQTNHFMQNIEIHKFHFGRIENNLFNFKCKLLIQSETSLCDFFQSAPRTKKRQGNRNEFWNSKLLTIFLHIWRIFASSCKTGYFISAKILIGIPFKSTNESVEMNLG